MKGEVRSLSGLILDFLQVEAYPISLRDIQNNLNKEYNLKVTQQEIKDEIKILNLRGYDVREIKKKGQPHYLLRRFGKLSEQDYYKPVGTIRLPALLTADWHIGSKGWSEQAYLEMLKDIDSLGVKDVLVDGDILQGLGVYQTEREDLETFSIDEQVEMMTDYLKMIPRRVDIHLTMGGHEQKLKGQHRIGFDALSSVASQFKNVNYYEYIANLTLKNKYNVLMMHGSGGPSYASSYSIERVFRELIEKPDILIMGHLHRLGVTLKPPNHLLCQVGTLQRESAYLVFKGLAAQLGWIVLKDYDFETADYLIRRPRVY